MVPFTEHSFSWYLSHCVYLLCSDPGSTCIIPGYMGSAPPTRSLPLSCPRGSFSWRLCYCKAKELTACKSLQPLEGRGWSSPVRAQHLSFLIKITRCTDLQMCKRAQEAVVLLVTKSSSVSKTLLIYTRHLINKGHSIFFNFFFKKAASVLTIGVNQYFLNVLFISISSSFIMSIEVKPLRVLSVVLHQRKINKICFQIVVFVFFNNKILKVRKKTLLMYQKPFCWSASTGGEVMKDIRKWECGP